MKRNCLVFAFAFMLLLAIGANATMVGDVTVKVNNGSIAYSGASNIFEIYLENDMDLYGLSIGFWFKHLTPTMPVNVPFTWVVGYGTKPTASCGSFCNIIKTEAAYIGIWDITGGVVVTVGKLANDSLLLGGAAGGGTPAPLPVSLSRLVYSAQWDIPASPDSVDDAICVDNINYPPAGTWTFAEISNSYAPTFNGFANPGGEVDPDAPDVCFDLRVQPCQAPTWLAGGTPTSPISRNKCFGYTFDFNADPGPDCQPPAVNPGYAVIGPRNPQINATTGELTITSPGATGPGCGSEGYTVTYTNCCPKEISYGFTIIWTNNLPTIINCPPTPDAKVAKGGTYCYTFEDQDADICEQLEWDVFFNGPCQSPDGPPVGTFEINPQTGKFCFHTDLADGGKTFCFGVTLTDGCEEVDTCCFCVEVLEFEPEIVIHIEKTHGTIQGHIEHVLITKEFDQDPPDTIGGFDILIAYDASALNFLKAVPGVSIGPKPDGDGWEYFTYRYGAFGNCDGPCPSGFLRIIAIADQNDGPHHPFWDKQFGYAVLADLSFYVTNDRTYECQFIPIRFAWFDCGDNGFSDKSGNILWISLAVKEFEWNQGYPDSIFNWFDPRGDITNMGCGWGFTYGGACAPACDSCYEWYQRFYINQDGDTVWFALYANGDTVSTSFDRCKNRPVRKIIFWNGGIDIACADSIDKRGDLNLNGIENEIADAVLYTNYFIYGSGVFDIAYEGQVAASDVNNDGRPVTVGDLVYLIRIITGDELAYPKLAPFANSATISVVNGLVSSTASNEIGGIYATFKVNGAYSITNRTDMELLSNEVNGELKVLVYSGLNNTTNRIQSGSNELFVVNGEAELVNVEVADYNGNMLTTRVNKSALPTAFSLKQNVPNPFNPTTKIGLDLPSVSDWALDIYNVAGQLVRSYSGHGQGSIQVDVDASGLASGLYFYRATAGAFTDTKKMVLMK